MGSIRIIGGQWRSRRVSFLDIPGLRPTQDRIRETLFNWLTPVIGGAKCLDLFAGSGVLGFEALSRGAQFSCFVDAQPKIIAELQANAEKLGLNANQFAIIQGQVSPRLPPLPQAPFDIVFLDPPFHQNLLPIAIEWLLHSQSLKPGALIYLEMENDLNLVLPPAWEILRHKKTRTLTYQLITII